MKWLGLVLATTMTVGTLTGCGVTKQWVIDRAKEIAVKTVDKQITKLNENTIAPKFAEIEESLGRKIDSNADGLWSDDELAAAIKSQSKQTFTEVKDLLLSEAGENADKSLTEKLKDLPSKSDQFKYLLYLVAAYILSKLGIKVGPKGLQTLRERLEKRKKTQEVDLS
jgi:hypothetical protein